MEEKQKNEKMSYEELENVVRGLSEQNNMLIAQLRERNTAMMFKRLDYLFKILENNGLFDYVFIEEVVKEITEALEVKKEEEPKTPESDGEA